VLTRPSSNFVVSQKVNALAVRESPAGKDVDTEADDPIFLGALT
jgi:hypothetical protein